MKGGWWWMVVQCGLLCWFWSPQYWQGRSENGFCLIVSDVLH
jgi:hypothetical protein